MTVSGAAGTPLTSNTAGKPRRIRGRGFELEIGSDQAARLERAFHAGLEIAELGLEVQLPVLSDILYSRVDPHRPRGDDRKFERFEQGADFRLFDLSVRSAPTRLSVFNVPFALASRSPTFALKSSCVSAPASFSRPSICSGPLAISGKIQLPEHASQIRVFDLERQIRTVQRIQAADDAVDVHRQLAQRHLHGHAHIARRTTGISAAPHSPFNAMG